MSTESNTMSTAERIVSALTAALPMPGAVTFTPATTTFAAAPADGGFTYRATGWPGHIVVTLTDAAILPEMVADDPAAALTPAVESALATVGASSGASVESASPDQLGEHLKLENRYTVVLDGREVLHVSIHEGVRMWDTSTAGAMTAAVDEDFLRNVHRIRGVDMELSVVIGRTTLTVAELMRIKPGQVLELDRAAGAPADILVNGRHMASGEVVVQDLDFAVKITSIRDENSENA
ncbi:FliM/FliN family flagellar motor switch protein (plasmid) [Citricoccus nitrophenolicus]